MPEEKRNWLELFQWFHRYPETGYQEYETTRKIEEVLREEGIEILSVGLSTGVIGIIRGKNPGENICLRADIDALPVKEETHLEYSSENAGLMHACGHDFHITAALCTASILNKEKNRLYGNIYLVFQPAEEVAGGAKYILEKGALKNIREFYGFHAEPSLRPGEISIQSGAVMAAVDEFGVTVYGKGTHGATPHLGVNPIPSVLQAIQQISGIISNQLNPLHANVISVTHIEAGNTWNVIPEKAFFEGTVRTTDADDREKIKKEITKIVHSLEESENIKVKLQYHDGPPAVINDTGLCELAETVAKRRGLSNVLLSPAMVGDDFSFFPESVSNAKGLYIKVGTGPSENLHNPHFKVDPSGLEEIADFFAELLLQKR